MKLTQNFTLEEMTVSATAKRLKIINDPSITEIMKLQKLCSEVLQPIRDKFKKPIVVTSGYRCPKLNAAVGGVRTSQHLLGEAADISVGGKYQNKQLFDLIFQMIINKEIQVGQLIDEYDYRWLHISLPYKKINQVLHIR